MATWKPDSFKRHHDKRLNENPSCLSEIVGAVHGITEKQYSDLSHDVINDHWGKIVASKRDGNRGWYPESMYFIDDELVLVITDKPQSWIRTCYHMHLGNECKEVRSWSVGRRRLRCQQSFTQVEDCEYRNVKVLKGVKDV